MRGRRFLGTITGVALLVAPALAANESDRADCESSDPTRMMKGCTRIIEGGGESSQRRASAHYLRGIAHMARGDIDRALADFEESIRLVPSNGLAFNERGVAFQTKGDLARAIADFDRAIDLLPRDGSIHYNRARALLKIDEIDRALADIDQAIQFGPTAIVSTAGNDAITKLTAARIQSDYLHLRAHAKFLQARYADAATDYAQVIALRRDDPYPALQLHLARLRSGQSGAVAELQSVKSAMKPGVWPYPLIDLLLSRKTVMETISSAQTAEQRCEAQYYIGEWNLLRLDDGAAEMALRAAVSACDKDFSEYQLARSELLRLRR